MTFRNVMALSWLRANVVIELFVIYKADYYLAPGGGCEVLLSPCLCVCVSVGTVISQELSNRKNVVDTSLNALLNETIQIWASREMTTQKYVNIWRLTWTNSYTEVIVSHKIVKKICAKCGDDQTSFDVIFDVCYI